MTHRLHTPVSFMRLSGRHIWLPMSMVLGCCGWALAQTDDTGEVGKLLRAGKHTEALAKADQLLANRPRDAQLRFLKGVIQTESGKLSEAVSTFSKLTEDFPELPEPYNNLAVVYASQGQFDKARASLEMAIRTNPSYATAHENLGDVYARLASQAYSKALQLDTSNAAVAPKLNLIRSLFSGSPKAVSEAPAPAAAPAVSPSPPPPPPAPPAVTNAQALVQRDIKAAVDGWAKAWSSKNMDAYFAAYAANFLPASGQSRAKWEADRRARIVPRSRIQVEVNDLVVSVDGDRATAKFRQIYASDTLNSSNRKTLDLVKSGGRWLIVREIAGS